MGKSAVLMEYIRQELLRGRKVDLKEDDDLLVSGIINSLGILQLVAFIEEKIGIQVPIEDVVYENFRSVAALSQYLEAR